MFAQTDRERCDVARLVGEGRAVVVPLSIEIGDDASEEPQPTNPDRLEVITVARLARLKGLDVLVRAMEALSSEVHLTIVGGDEGEGERLRDILSTLGIEHAVSLAGPIYSPALDELYRRSDVFLLAPSYNEGTSLASLQAALHGCALILSDAVEVPGLKNGAQGWRVEPTVPSVQLALQRAVGAKQDGSLLQLRRAAQDLARTKDLSTIAPRYLEHMRGRRE
jgi:glycosyltransferase involved in cell wall biosynthesis